MLRDSNDHRKAAFQLVEPPPVRSLLNGRPAGQRGQQALFALWQPFRGNGIAIQAPPARLTQRLEGGRHRPFDRLPLHAPRTIAELKHMRRKRIAQVVRQRGCLHHTHHRPLILTPPDRYLPRHRHPRDQHHHRQQEAGSPTGNPLGQRAEPRRRRRFHGLPRRVGHQQSRFPGENQVGRWWWPRRPDISAI